MFEFLKRKPLKPKSERKPSEIVQIDTTPLEFEVETKVQALQNLVLEQRAMLRQTHKILCMIADHKRYEFISPELDKLKNAIDKIK